MTLRKNAILFVIILTVLSGALVAGCAKKETAQPLKSAITKSNKAEVKSDVIATIGSGAVTVQDYKDELSALPPPYRSMAILNKEQFLDSLISKELLLGEAKKKNLQNNENVKKLLKKAEEEIMIQELIGIEISDKVRISDDEINTYYEKNKEKYAEPATMRASHILLDSEAMARKLLIDLNNGADFAKAAKEYSIDTPTKDIGGDTGYFAKGTLIPEFEAECEKLKVGELSGVIKTDLGYHIIKLTDKKEAGIKPLTEVKTDIENELFLEKQVTLYDDLMKRLKTDQDIKINKEVLEKISLD